MKPSLPSFSPSFALISVLALVSLAALTATAFLASARLERQATRSIGSQTQLDMALSSGMECAAQTINIMCEPKWNTTAVYWRGTNDSDWTNEIGYLLLGRPNSINNLRWTYFCGFSPAVFKNIDTNAFLIEGTNIRQDSYLADIGPFMTNMTKGFVTNPPATNTNCTQIPLLGGRTSPHVGWVYISQTKTIAGTTNTTNTPVARFAYFMEDLQGYIDAERMGGLTNRDTGTNPQEICLTNMLGTNSTNFCNSNNRIKYLSPGMMIYAGGINNSNLAYVATRLLSWTNSPQFIPLGIPVSSADGYSRGGYNKSNLNTLLSDINPPNALQKVSVIATHISSNIPSFASTRRSGAMSGGAYLSNIAANIVDYVDTDSIPTVDNGTNPSFLGIENIPWPNELFDRITFTEVTTSGLIRIQLKDYVEVWNMGNKTISNGTTTITLSNNYDLMLTMTNTLANVGFKTNLNKFIFESGSLGNRDFALTNDLLPNGYLVLDSSSTPATRRLAVQITNNSSTYSTDAVRNAWGIFAAEADATTNMSYTASVGTNVIQKTISGRWSRFLSPTYKMTPPSGLYIFCNNIGYASQTAINGVPSHTGGDPRAQLFLSNPLYNQNYTNKYASPGGRNVGRFQLGTYPESEVNPAKFWPDNGHATNSDYGGNPTSFSQSPTSFASTPATNNWVMKRNDTGTLTNIIELGNIYDPLQWRDQAGSGVANQPGLWTNLTANATADSRFGGRNTLRIGRAEFQRFAFTNYTATNPAIPNMGLSAAALLDIFCATNNFDTGGRINLNTAPAPVLRALALGINLKSDPALLAGGAKTTNHPVPAIMAEAFAQGVMRFRSKYPFLSPSQLPFIGTDNNWPNTNTWPSNSVFGNTNTITWSTNIPGSLASSVTNIGVSEWNDQAAEEWFSKIYQLSTVQSFNYRVYVVAQLVGTNLMPKGAMARKYYHLYLRNNSPTNISAGPYMNYQSAY